HGVGDRREVSDACCGIEGCKNPRDGLGQASRDDTGYKFIVGHRNDIERASVCLAHGRGDLRVAQCGRTSDIDDPVWGERTREYVRGSASTILACEVG